MLIADELKDLEWILLDRSSLKERAFYFFLIEAPFSYPTEKALSDIDQICLSVFCTDAPDKQEIIQARRKMHPIRGMHYTGNLIELSAMAQDNVRLERENLKSHCDNHSARNFYILNHLFSNISSAPPIPQGAIDEISLYLYKDEFPREGWKPLLLRALQEASDLTDFYVIQQGYLQAMADNPIVHRVEDIDYVRDVFVSFIKKTERRVKSAILVVSLLLLSAISYWLVPLIINRWNEAEPIIAIISMIFYLIVLILGLMGVILEKIEILDRFRKKIINWVFKRKGFDLPELKARLERLGPNQIK